ncbi:MAG: shikimate dehydrogenase [Bacteroidetes bacterium]|nr:MAG: shikimate dehydrogenase [Bacteroidota bacterium]
MKLYGLIGFPLSHSFSKEYFTVKFQREGIQDSRYELFPIRNIEEFPSLLENHPQLAGINITIPYKQSVLQYLDDKSNLPAGLDACNCIKIVNGIKYGFNTDVVGFEKSFTSKLKSSQHNALVLGTGGASMAVQFVLKKLGIDFKLVGRKNTELSYEDLNEKVIKETAIIINTTPLGTYPKSQEFPNIPYGALSPYHYVYDLIYNPSKTLFLQKAEEKGATIQNGFDMLAIQAEESWRIWNE